MLGLSMLARQAALVGYLLMAISAKAPYFSARTLRWGVGSGGKHKGGARAGCFLADRRMRGENLRGRTLGGGTNQGQNESNPRQ
jgi:hypothetical protein